MEIQRTKASLVQIIDMQTNFTANETLTEFGLYPKDRECEFKCPEIDACIESSLWCNGKNTIDEKNIVFLCHESFCSAGYPNCPSGYDESTKVCGATRKLLELPATIFAALGCIAAGMSACLIFCMIGLVRRRKKHLEPKQPPPPAMNGTTYTLPKHHSHNNSHDTFKKDSLFFSHDS
jgi:hypothetical protein